MKVWFCFVLLIASVGGKRKEECKLPEPDYKVPSVQTEALILAARKGDVRMVHRMQKTGAEMDERNEEGLTALMTAAAHGEFMIARFLVRVGCELEKADRLGRTPIMHSAMNGQTTTVDVLAELGADLAKADLDGSTPLLLSTKQNHTDVAELLYSLEAPATFDTYGWHPIHYAARNGNLDLLTLFYSTDATRLTAHNRSILSEAGHLGHTHLVRYILQQGGLPEDSVDADGQTPAMRAVLNCHCDILALLSPVSLQQTDTDGRSVLHHACSRGCTACLPYLLENIPVEHHTAPDRYGHTPVLLAAESGNLQTVKALEPTPAQLNTPSSTGLTCLMYAARKGKTRLLKYLLERGADPTLQDAQGRDAAAHARENARAVSEQILMDAMEGDSEEL